MNVPVLRRQHEHGNWHVVAAYEKWDDVEELDKRGLLGLQAAQLRQELPPTSEGIWDHGNLLLTAGITRMLNLLIGAGGQALDHTHCRIGVGDGTTAVTAADTDLSAAAGSTHRYFTMADTSYPSVATNVLTVVASFLTADGNFAWNEWGIDAGTANGNTVTAPLLNRKVPSTLGTKTTGTWALTVSITIT